MKMLETLTPFERTDAIDFCLAGIANLTSSVKDASSYLPAYDQRTYGDVSLASPLILCPLICSSSSCLRLLSSLIFTLCNTRVVYPKSFYLLNPSRPTSVLVYWSIPRWITWLDQASHRYWIPASGRNVPSLLIKYATYPILVY